MTPVRFIKWILDNFITHHVLCISLIRIIVIEIDDGMI